MKKLIIASFILVALFSRCGSGSESEIGTQKEFTTESAPEEDTLVIPAVGITAEIRLELEKYFSTDLCVKIENYVSDFDTLSSDAAFQNNYREGRNISDEMTEQLNKPVTSYLKKLAKGKEYWYPVDEIFGDLEIFSDQLGPLVISCVAECTEIDMTYDLLKMQRKAQETLGNADDDFMKLLVSIDGEFGYAGCVGFKSWFNQTWDLGGSSLLGDGQLLSIIKATIQYKKNHKLFNEELKLLKSDYLDALSWGSSYQFTPEKILVEFEAILALDYFTNEELVEINELYERIKNRDTSFQFDCENQDCSYG